ncbi:LPS export ABC transporter periplasmic protein LptC [Sphingobacterium olei]|uniref:LPS export ABC transporter periplasmic protein LptC n=1 Tax=Sphingobacterium olei TaxID=2571155 RepID=A0A4U0P074_9SPHI|nr:LPS export ABC transporter periplasmic protein LptC [Sphingobacterium olei]TJZ60591.1 LPS export ABC transporter periplasmic protein LptC [Sphingobacterium olei]
MIFSQHIRFYPLLLFLLIGVLSFSSCENDMKDIDRLANIQEEEAVDISKNVKIIYSDSAKVKAQLTAPEMRIYHDTTGNYEFKKGVQIIFYDETSGQELQRVTSDYALQRAKESITEFKKNVVITRADGSKIKTEELFYDESKKIYYNHVNILFEDKDGKISYQAASFTADDKLVDIKTQFPTGYFVPSSQSQLPSFGN